MEAWRRKRSDGGRGMSPILPHEWGLDDEFGYPQIGGSSRGLVGAVFFTMTPIFSYGGLSRGSAGLVLTYDPTQPSAFPHWNRMILQATSPVSTDAFPS